MTLPKQVLPIFTLKIPSTGKTVKFRQFTVREEKTMIQAQESEDIEVITNAVKEIILACVPDIKDINELALFDVEYIITKIRAKSVGEHVDLNMICDVDENHKRTPVVIDVEKIEVTFPENHSKKIDLYDDVGIVMKYPTLKHLKNMETFSGMDAIVSCVDYIYTADEMFHSEDHGKEELIEFLNSLTVSQIEKIETKFFDTMPAYKYDMKYMCVECGHVHEKTIKGLANFFV